MAPGIGRQVTPLARGLGFGTQAVPTWAGNRAAGAGVTSGWRGRARLHREGRRLQPGREVAGIWDGARLAALGEQASNADLVRGMIGLAPPRLPRDLRRGRPGRCSGPPGQPESAERGQHARPRRLAVRRPAALAQVASNRVAAAAELGRDPLRPPGPAAAASQPPPRAPASARLPSSAREEPRRSEPSIPPAPQGVSSSCRQGAVLPVVSHDCAGLEQTAS